MNSNLWRRLAALLASAGLAGSLLATVAAPAAYAGITSPACAFADSETATECVISAPWTVGGGGVIANNFTPALPGPYAFHKTLHILAGGSLNASTAGAPGITITIDNTSGAAADSLGGTGQLIMDAGASLIDTNDAAGNNQPGGQITVTATGGGQLAAGSTIKSENDSVNGDAGAITLTFGATSSLGGTISSQATAGTTGNSGGNIRVFVTGDLTMPTTGLIISDKNANGGRAGSIRIDVSGDMLMQGTGTPATSARILAKHPGATNGAEGGDIRIDVGTGPLGIFTMETGTRIDSGGQGFAGNIWISAGDEVNVNDGAAVLAGQRSEQNTRGHGGRIFVVAGCEANIFGTLSTQGQDPGADLIHVEGCEVHVGPNGLIELTGSGHQPSTPVSCDGTDDDDTTVPGAPASEFNQPGEVFRPDHLATSSFCVEIWARHVLIDAGGEINADFALSGGTEGDSWVDIFAQQDIVINGPLVAPYAIHANSGLGNDRGGDIRVVAQNSFVTITGLAIQGNALGAGGDGGTVLIEAAGNVSLDGSSIQARGAGSGGAAPTGGTITARSYQGTLTGNAPGELNTDAVTDGLVFLTSCLGTVYTGTIIASNAGTAIQPNLCVPLNPPIPAYVVFDPAGRWTACGVSTISGIKFNDLDGDGIQDAGELGLSGWTIHLFNAVFHATQVTGVGGAYTFTGVPSGTFNICEQMIVAVPAWQQTFPVGPGAGLVDCTVVVDPAADNPNPGQWGYSVTVDNSLCCEGQVIINKDFGNRQQTFQAPEKTGMKFHDLDGDHIKDAGEPGLANWPINLYGPGPGFAFSATTNTAADGTYSFVIPSAGDWRVCEGPAPASLPGAWVQTFPILATPPPNPGETIINTCPAPNTFGYQFNVPAAGGPNLVNNDFGNFIPGDDCQKPTAIAIMNQAFPGNLGPDFTVHTDAGQLIQPIVDAAFDKNGDKYVIIMVIAHADNSLGGTANQSVVISKNYTLTANSNFPFGLIGCSVTLTGGGAGPAIWIKDTAQGKQFTLNGKPTNILLADLHGGNSAVGVQADGTKRYLRNVGASGNVTGILVNGSSNTIHNGGAGGNSGDGVVINGSSNYVTDTNSWSNGGNGFNVTGASNQLLKLDVGEKNTPNALDGVRVTGNSNTLSEIDAYNNGRWGLNVIGNSNQILKNVAGDKNKGNGFAGTTFGGYRIVGTGNQLTENKANANTGIGFLISGTTSTGNKLKNNSSNTNSSGGDLENSSFEYKLDAAITNQGGNKKDNVNFTSTAASPGYE